VAYFDRSQQECVREVTTAAAAAAAASDDIHLQLVRADYIPYIGLQRLRIH